MSTHSGLKRPDYEELRNMHIFIMDTPGPVCERIEKEIEGRQQNSYRQEVETRRKDEIIVENRKAREQLYKETDFI